MMFHMWFCPAVTTTFVNTKRRKLNNVKRHTMCVCVCVCVCGGRQPSDHPTIRSTDHSSQLRALFPPLIKNWAVNTIRIFNIFPSGFYSSCLSIKRVISLCVYDADKANFIHAHRRNGARDIFPHRPITHRWNSSDALTFQLTATHTIHQSL